jgi:hypothetical protein
MIIIKCSSKNQSYSAKQDKSCCERLADLFMYQQKIVTKSLKNSAHQKALKNAVAKVLKDKLSPDEAEEYLNKINSECESAFSLREREIDEHFDIKKSASSICNTF